MRRWGAFTFSAQQILPLCVPKQTVLPEIAAPLCRSNTAPESPHTAKNTTLPWVFSAWTHSFPQWHRPFADIFLLCLNVTSSPRRGLNNVPAVTYFHMRRLSCVPASVSEAVNTANKLRSLSQYTITSHENKLALMTDVMRCSWMFEHCVRRWISNSCWILPPLYLFSPEKVPCYL